MHGDSALPVAAAPSRMPEGERVYAIGDVHGRFDLLEDLVGLIRADNAGRTPASVSLVLVGDLIDRGPDSAEVVRRCMEFAERTARFIVLKGNHEAMLVDALDGDFLAFSLWLRSGGDAALASWGVDGDLIAQGLSRKLLQVAGARVPLAARAWLAGLPLMHRAGDYAFVHAGIRPGIAIDLQVPEDLLWIRDDFLQWNADHDGIVVVHGHSISDEGLVSKPNRIGIDTGAYRTGVLSAVMLEADERWALSTGKAAATRIG